MYSASSLSNLFGPGVLTNNGPAGSNPILKQAFMMTSNISKFKTYVPVILFNFTTFPQKPQA